MKFLCEKVKPGSPSLILVLVRKTVDELGKRPYARLRKAVVIAAGLTFSLVQLLNNR